MAILLTCTNGLQSKFYCKLSTGLSPARQWAMEQRAMGQWAMGYGFRIPNRIPNTLNKYTHMGQGKWLTCSFTTRSFTTRSFTTLKTMKGTGYDEGYDEGGQGATNGGDEGANYDQGRDPRWP